MNLGTFNHCLPLPSRGNRYLYRLISSKVDLNLNRLNFSNFHQLFFNFLDFNLKIVLWITFSFVLLLVISSSCETIFFDSLQVYSHQWKLTIIFLTTVSRFFLFEPVSHRFSPWGISKNLYLCVRFGPVFIRHTYMQIAQEKVQLYSSRQKY